MAEIIAPNSLANRRADEQQIANSGVENDDIVQSIPCTKGSAKALNKLNHLDAQLSLHHMVQIWDHSGWCGLIGTGA